MNCFKDKNVLNFPSISICICLVYSAAVFFPPWKSGSHSWKKSKVSVKKMMPVKIFENFCPWKKMLCPWKISNNLPMKVQKVCVKKFIIEYINKYNFLRRCKQILFGYWGVIHTMYLYLRRFNRSNLHHGSLYPIFVGKRS